ncbi:MAG: ABC transporter substrate-binding protein [Acidimicrobiia bacterium]
MEACPKTFIRKTLFLLCVISFVLVISGCSTLGGKSKSEDVPKLLVVWSPVDYSHDPLQAKSSEQYFLSSLENETLFGLDKKGNLTYNLAQNYKVSNDGKTISIELGKFTFTDGSLITGADVKATLSRVAKNGGDLSKLLSNVNGYGTAKTGGDFTGIKVIGKDGVQFSLINPDPFFVFHLAHPATGIVPSTSIGIQGDLVSTNIHSGLYSADVISNELNATTAFTPRTKTLPVINVVKKSEEDMAARPDSQKVDILLGLTNPSISFSQISIPQLAVASWNIYVKNASSPFANVKFRKAILEALDEKESIAAYATKAVAPKKFLGGTFDSVECSTSCDTNVKDAKKLLAELYPDGKYPEIKIDIEENEIQKSLADSAVSSLQEIGIKATVKTYNSTDLSNEIARGNVELFRFGWVTDFAVGADFLVKSFKADSTENVAGVADASLEEAISEYQSATTAKSRIDKSKTLQDEIKSLWLMRPVAHFHKIVTVNNNVQNIDFDFYSRVNIGKIRVKK